MILIVVTIVYLAVGAYLARATMEAMRAERSDVWETLPRMPVHLQMAAALIIAFCGLFWPATVVYGLSFAASRWKIGVALHYYKLRLQLCVEVFWMTKIRHRRAFRENPDLLSAFCQMRSVVLTERLRRSCMQDPQGDER